MPTDHPADASKDRGTTRSRTKPIPWLSEYYVGPDSPEPENWTAREERALKLDVLERQFARADASLQRLAVVSLTRAEQDAILALRNELGDVRNRIVRRLLDS